MKEKKYGKVAIGLSLVLCLLNLEILLVYILEAMRPQFCQCTIIYNLLPSEVNEQSQCSGSESHSLPLDPCLRV